MGSTEDVGVEEVVVSDDTEDVSGYVEVVDKELVVVETDCITNVCEDWTGDGPTDDDNLRDDGWAYDDVTDGDCPTDEDG